MVPCPPDNMYLKHWWYVKDDIFFTHPWSAEEHIIRCIHIYNQKLLNVLYFTEERLDDNFSNGLYLL